MARYEITVPKGVPAELEVTCTEHGTGATYPQYRSTVSFHCPDCSRELTVDLANTADWRAWNERC